MCNVTDPFNFVQGDTPLLVSMPHSGIQLLPQMETRLTDEARTLPDTDWFLPELYAFLAQKKVSVISANYSRYVVDLNRPVDDAPLYSSKTTGLFPDILFADRPVFLPNQQHSQHLKQQIKTQVWHPYHQKVQQELARIKQRFGFAILFEAHSIAAQVPMLFDGVLPDFNFGSNQDLACDKSILDALAKIVDNSSYSQVCNGRFKGGYITRHFGQPDQNVHAIQLELSQATYLKQLNKTATATSCYQIDPVKQQGVTPVLIQLIDSLLQAKPIHTDPLHANVERTATSSVKPLASGE